MEQERISRDRTYIEIAEVVAKRATCGRLKVGCVITVNNRIISTGYNGPLPEDKHCTEATCDLSKPCQRSIHAEANAITAAAKVGIPLEGSTLYCLVAPCNTCAQLIIQSGIKKVIYKENFRDAKGIETLLMHDIKVNQFSE